MRMFDKKAAAACLASKRIHVAGDSTTRDTFYELLAVGSHPIFQKGAGEWVDREPAPRSPMSSLGRDVQGMCYGQLQQGQSCVRDEAWPSPAGGMDTRISYQFLMKSNSSWEEGQMRKHLRNRTLDAAFVQCPIYEWFHPDAYNYSLSKEERAKPSNNRVGERHLEAMGISCLQYVQNVVQPSLAPNGRIYLLGTTPLPGWTQAQGGTSSSSSWPSSP